MCWPSGRRWPVAEVMEQTLTREMGLTHGEFFRSLPHALSPERYRIDGTTVTVTEGEGRVVIELGPQGERRLTPMVRIPVTPVTFRFSGLGQEAVTAFMRHFERHYQRGGG